MSEHKLITYHRLWYYILYLNDWHFGQLNIKQYNPSAVSLNLIVRTDEYIIGLWNYTFSMALLVDLLTIHVYYYTKVRALPESAEWVRLDVCVDTFT